MDLETVDVARLRALVALHESYLRAHPNTQQVRQRAIHIAAGVAGEYSLLVRKAQELPPAQSLVPPRGVSSPIARDDRFDAAVEDFIVACYLTIDEIEGFQRRLTANDTMHDDAVVAAVLAEAAKSDQPQWNSPLSWALGIRGLRVRDALEELAHKRAIVINDRSRTGIDDFLFTVTAYGRRLARGSVTPQATAPAIYLTQHISHSTIANAGFTFGSVQQNVTINPEVREIVDALARLGAAIGDGPGATVAVTLTQATAEELRTNGWGDKAAALLRAIPGTLGSMTALAANAKPAYDLVRSLAAALGVDWPPLP
jgi:hypothetical protein